MNDNILEIVTKEWELLNGDMNNDKIEHRSKNDQMKRCIKILNMDESIEYLEIYNLFKPYGTIYSIDIKTIEETNQYEILIEYDSETSVEKSLEMNGNVIKNKMINVSLFYNKKKQPTQSNKK